MVVGWSLSPGPCSPGRLRRHVAPGPGCTSVSAQGAPLRRRRLFLVGVLVLVCGAVAQGQLGGVRSDTDSRNATVAGALGAIGAACIIWSFRTGGIPLYVMPLVFGGAPIVNVPLLDGHSPAEGRAEPDAVSGLPVCVDRRGLGLYFSPSRIDASG